MPTFRARDGVEIAYQVWEQESDLPLVVLQHGFIADSQVNWVAPGVVAALTGARRRVATIDARGHGESGKPHDRAYYGEARMAEDLTALVDVLGEPSFDLVGYSMGAIISLLTAIRDRRVRRLLVGGVGASVVELGGVDTRLIGGESLQQALHAEDISTITDPATAAFRAFIDQVGGDRIALASQAASVHDQPIALDTITAPTLVIAGRDDPLAASPETLSEAIANATLRIITGDHQGAVADPAFTAELIDFLAQ